ncbi:MAG TPA: endonuclease III [Sulfurihydrogenibium sp.]|uniref:endonuclease III n=1 Tax=Sulfurihydrogenibium sp. (strain YO3AOP1) TaxID=436114 RepID=UPI0001724BB0|nr:endonuclease III [Sulfurihydrogenibium sp. YO3AOP1]ACD67095.1 endonuclease III [Sulfurihydrogenibium sp. YO3AOP1]HBT98657.1 endonuclease III [Sulfurihydrogenibium sp.]
MAFTQQQLIERLKKHFPDPKIELNYENEFQLLIVIILSAQTTDKKVNQVSPILFKKYPTPQALANADLKDLEEIIKPLGFYKRKAKLIKECAKAILEKFSGQIPKTLEELTSLPGVGRKTASALLVNAYKIPAIVVDTHVKRVAKRLKITNQTSPEKVEKDLTKFFSKENWVYISNALVLFGRYICTANKPKCKECYVSDICPYEKKNL